MSFSLRFLLGFMTLEAFGCVAMARPTPWNANAFVTFAVGAIVIVALKAIAARGSDRDFFVGFTLVSAVYLMLSVSPLFGYGVTSRLLTTRALVALEPVLHKIPPPSRNAPFSGIAPEMFVGYPVDEATATRQLYYQIGQCFWALLLGCGGGLSLQWLRAEALAKGEKQ